MEELANEKQNDKICKKKKKKISKIVKISYNWGF